MEQISIALTYTSTTIFNYKTKEIKRVIRKGKFKVTKFKVITNRREPYKLRPRSK